MKTIKYVFTDGKKAEIEVSDEFAEEYKKLEEAEKLNDRTETRRHKEYIEVEHSSGYKTDEFLLKKLNAEKLMKILSVIRRKDRELFKLHYFDYISMTEIARKEDVHISAISRKLKRIKKKIHELWLK